MTRGFPCRQFTCSNLDKALSRTSFYSGIVLSLDKQMVSEKLLKSSVTKKFFLTIMKVAITK